MFGKTGWIGSLVGELLQESGENVHFATARLENREAIIREIEQVSTQN